MSWIVTASGHELDLRNPAPGAITLPCIAHSLAQTNRYTGHARRPYSVAEHSLLVCEIVERLFPSSAAGLLAALMHDAHEAYTGDLHTPGKHEVGEAWHRFEHRLEQAVRNAFMLQAPSHTYRRAIKEADLMALATEREQLLPSGPRMTPWPMLTQVRPVDWVDLMDPARCANTWHDWRCAFADRYGELDFARNDSVFKLSMR